MAETRETPPRVSVVVPCFNHGHFLARAIDSILAQSRQDFEVLVVDDGSTDQTRAVVQGYPNRGERRVRYVWQENRGLPGARNTGIRAARGELIALLDADDSWRPEFLAATGAYLEAHPEAGAVHTGCFFIDARENRLPQVSTGTVPAGMMRTALVGGEFFIPSAVLVRRRCFDQVGLFDESLRASEDWDMWLRVAAAVPFGSLPDPLVEYRIHDGNMSGGVERMLRTQLAVVEKHFGRPAGDPAGWPEDRQRSAAAVFRYAAQGFFLRKEPAIGRDFLRQALAAHPASSTSLEALYELACCDQPLGRRVAGSHVAVERNAALLLPALDAIFSDPDLPGRLRGRRGQAFGNAWFALALVAYGGGRLDLVRRYLPRAVGHNPRLLGQRQFQVTWLKGLLGRRLVDLLKQIRPAGRPPLSLENSG